jgi:hypothetical protein
MRSIIKVKLLERAQPWFLMINQLVESRVAHLRRIAVSLARQMPQRLPVVHLLDRVCRRTAQAQRRRSDCCERILHVVDLTRYTALLRTSGQTGLELQATHPAVYIFSHLLIGRQQTLASNDDIVPPSSCRGCSIPNAPSRCECSAVVKVVSCSAGDEWCKVYGGQAGQRGEVGCEVADKHLALRIGGRRDLD